MNAATRTLPLIAWLIGAITMPLPSTPRETGIELGIHTVYGADERTLDQITFANEAFEAAGLILPSLTIHVHPDSEGCDGFRGKFNTDGSGRRVDLCLGLQFTVLHEFAHAWERHTVEDSTRTASLTSYCLNAWNEHDAKWRLRGIEVAAGTIAKGVLSDPLKVWEVGDADVLDAGYQLLTGTRSLRFAGEVSGAADSA